jgi:membrane-bound lytic murein transglycosylase D
MAAAVIGSDPKRYGFDLPSEEDIRKIYDVVSIPVVAPVARLSELSGVPVADLRAANSELDASVFSTPGRNFPLYLPLGTGERLSAALAAAPLVEDMPAARLASASAPSAHRAPAKSYVVKRGDTLAAISRKHGVAVETLASWNGLRRPYPLHVGQRLTVSKGSSGGEIAQAKESRGSDSILYTVRRGNTLQSIANLFAVRYRDIMSWNKLRGSALKTGQKLRIRPSQDFATHAYKVRRGDTLSSIARRFGVSGDDVLTANGLASAAGVRPGMRLVVYAPEAGAYTSTGSTR